MKMAYAPGEFGGFSKSQQMDLPRGPNDTSRLDWVKIFVFTLFGTTMWSVIASVAGAGAGNSSALAVAADAIGLALAIAVYGNVTTGFFDAAAAVGDAVVNFATGRQYAPSKENGYGYAALFLLLSIVAIVAGEFIGVALAWGVFSGKPNQLGLADYPANWDDGHAFGAEIILSAVLAWCYLAVSFKVYGKYSTEGANLDEKSKSSPDNDSRWQIPNWARGLLVALARAGVLLGASTRGAALQNPARYLAIAAYTGSWPLPGVFLAAPFIGAIAAAIVFGFQAMLELNTVMPEPASLNNKSVYASSIGGGYQPVQTRTAVPKNQALFGK